MKSIHLHPLVRAYRNKLSLSVKYGWGYRPSGLRARASGGEYLLYEDAPVRSLKPGYGGGIYGITVDSRGAMFDASGNSDLISKLQHKISVDEQTYSLMGRFISSGTSKYNWSLARDTSDYESGVLLVDQAKGDSALRYSGINENDFTRLFQDALNDNPSAIIYIKTHPNHKYRKKKSCFTKGQLAHPRVRILPEDLSPSDCFRICKSVYVGSSLMGMEALLHGCEVITYGWNFYAGWGLTMDRGREPFPPRSREHTLEELFQAAYIDYAHYYVPDTGEECGLGEILDHIELQKRQWVKFQGSVLSCKANSWKQYLIKNYVKGPRTKLKHITRSIEISPNSKVLLWGKQQAPELDASCTIIRVEDGFIRSNGLGAKLTFPLSWVFDDVGIYFDAGSPSRLENLLNESQYSASELAQARKLIHFLCSNKISKYNLDIQAVSIPPKAAGKRVILVPGQVDSDASIKYGSPKLKNNKELLKEIRRQHPDAYICYKPHPDLLSGARADKPLWQGIEEQIDHLVTDGDIISWIEAVSEVHTLTSTVGLEALMRKKPVFTYGLPFYAGWGLTHDWLECPRRITNRTLEELVYATLMEYPTYLNPRTGEYTTALNAAKLLANPDYTYDTRPMYIKILGSLKSFYNRCMRLPSY